MVTEKLILMCRLRPIFTVRPPKGISLVELIVVVTLFSVIMAAVLGLLGGAQSSFFNMDTSMELRNNLRLASEKMALELRNSGYQNSVAQFTILEGQGTGGSDIIRFSIPILCSANSTLLDVNGNPSYWGAPLTWSCNSYTCMDADGNCAALEYKYIQYSINASNQLERKVLAGNLTVVSSSTAGIGNDVKDLQVTLSNDTRMLTFVLTAQKKSPTARVVTVTYTNSVLLNNLEG